MTLPVVILAGGLATRLGELTHQTPKSMLLVAGKPFVAHQIELLKANNLHEIVLCIGHLGEMIMDYLGDGSKFGVKIRYSQDGSQLLGTGGAVIHALPLLGRQFFLLYGDSYLDCDYQSIELSFIKSGKLGLMTIYPNQNHWDKSNISYSNNIIHRYDKKHTTEDMQYIDYGLGLFQKEAFSSFAGNPGPLDLSNIYQHLIKNNQLEPYVVTQRFFEIGSYDGLNETADYITGNKKP